MKQTKANYLICFCSALLRSFLSVCLQYLTHILLLARLLAHSIYPQQQQHHNKKFFKKKTEQQQFHWRWLNWTKKHTHANKTLFQLKLCEIGKTPYHNFTKTYTFTCTTHCFMVQEIQNFVLFLELDLLSQSWYYILYMSVWSEMWKRRVTQNQDAQFICMCAVYAQ